MLTQADKAGLLPDAVMPTETPDIDGVFVLCADDLRTRYPDLYATVDRMRRAAAQEARITK